MNCASLWIAPRQELDLYENVNGRPQQVVTGSLRCFGLSVSMQDTGRWTSVRLTVDEPS